MKSGIYCWRLNNIPKYIGQSRDVKKRMKGNHSRCPVLNNAILKYGIDSFTVSVICYCSEEELNKMERYYIKKLKTHKSNGGYNLSKGGDYGYKLSEEGKTRISKANSGKSNGMYGKTGTRVILCLV
jgi:group I intron endonuclease